MIDDPTVPAHSRAVGRDPVPVPARRGRVYIVAPCNGEQAARVAALGPVIDAVRAAGFEAVAPAFFDTAGCVDDLLASVESDLDALASATAVVVLPGGERLLEATLAPSLGVPVVAVAGLLDLLEVA